MKTIADFYEQITTDTELQQKLAAAQTESKSDDPRAAFEQIIPVIREAGYDFTYDELKAYAEENKPDSAGEMSLEELDSVAGGKGFCIIFGATADKDGVYCYCVLSGSHESNNKDINLYCLLVGV